MDGAAAVGAAVVGAALGPVFSAMIDTLRMTVRVPPSAPRAPGRQTALVTAATAALFAATTVYAARRGAWAELPAWLYLAGIGLVLAVIDVRHHRLPNAIVLPSYPILAAALTVAAAATGEWSSLLRAAIAAVALVVFFAIPALLVPGGMGFGDVKLAGLLGAVLGFAGWSAVVIGVVVAFVVGAVVGALLMVSRRAARGAAFAFGPMMLLGAAAGLALGYDVELAAIGAVGA